MAYVPSHLVKGITHQQRVMRLYRNSLRHLLDWVIDRQTWRQEAVKLRERFDAHKHEKDRRVIHKILEAAEREFEKHKHPFPYVRKYSDFYLSVLKWIISVESFSSNYIENLSFELWSLCKVDQSLLIILRWWLIPYRPGQPWWQQVGKKHTASSSCKCSVRFVLWNVEDNCFIKSFDVLVMHGETLDDLHWPSLSFACLKDLTSITYHLMNSSFLDNRGVNLLVKCQNTVLVFFLLN